MLNPDGTLHSEDGRGLVAQDSTGGWVPKALFSGEGQTVGGTAPTTAEEKRAFTAVLKGHIGLDVAVFPESTIGFVLDAFARKALWACGLDYGHGTGHGVGAALNVHEGPISVSPRFGNTNIIKAGMVLSNEPGYYQADCFGVRIENLLAVEKADVPAVPDGKAFLQFSYLTLIPIDATCIDVTMLDAAERQWVDAYLSLIHI